MEPKISITSTIMNSGETADLLYYQADREANMHLYAMQTVHNI